MAAPDCYITACAVSKRSVVNKCPDRPLSRFVDAPLIKDSSEAKLTAKNYYISCELFELSQVLFHQLNAFKAAAVGNIWFALAVTYQC